MAGGNLRQGGVDGDRFYCGGGAIAGRIEGHGSKTVSSLTQNASGETPGAASDGRLAYFRGTIVDLNFADAAGIGDGTAQDKGLVVSYRIVSTGSVVIGDAGDRHGRVERVDAEHVGCGVWHLRIAIRILGAGNTDGNPTDINIGVGHIVGGPVGGSVNPGRAGKSQAAGNVGAEGQGRLERHGLIHRFAERHGNGEGAGGIGNGRRSGDDADDRRVEGIDRYAVGGRGLVGVECQVGELRRIDRNASRSYDTVVGPESSQPRLAARVTHQILCQTGDRPVDRGDIIGSEVLWHFAEGEAHHRGRVGIAQSRIDNVNRHRRVEGIDAEFNLGRVVILRIAPKVLGSGDIDGDISQLDVGVTDVVGDRVLGVTGAPDADRVAQRAGHAREEDQGRRKRRVHLLAEGHGDDEFAGADIGIADERIVDGHIADPGVARTDSNRVAAANAGVAGGILPTVANGDRAGAGIAVGGSECGGVGFTRGITNEILGKTTDGTACARGDGNVADVEPNRHLAEGESHQGTHIGVTEGRIDDVDGDGGIDGVDWQGFAIPRAEVSGHIGERVLNLDHKVGRTVVKRHHRKSGGQAVTRKDWTANQQAAGDLQIR